MNWYKVFYWITVADNFKTVTGTLAICLGIYTIIGFIAALGGGDDPWSQWKPASRKVYLIIMSIFFVSLFSWVLTPDKKDMMVIIAGGAVGNFVTSDSSAKAIPAELTKYVRNYLKNEAEDLDTETKEELGLATPKETFINKVKDMTKEEIIEHLKTDTTVLK